MDTAGKFLKTEREKKDLSLKDLAELLKIKAAYLKAIEDEDYQLIPGEVFVKGYLRAYADALGLDSSHVLSLYKQKAVNAALTDKKTMAANKKSFVNKIFLIAAAAFILTISLIVFTKREEEKPVAETREAVEKPEVRPVEQAGTEQERLSLEVTAIEFVWLSVSIDGSKPVQKLLRPGEVIQWTALKEFSVKIGNAGGAKLVFNGEEIGNLGPHGKVIKLVLPENKDTQKKVSQ